MVAADDSERNYAKRLGIEKEQIVQELGWDEDADDDIRADVEDACGTELLDEDADEVIDVMAKYSSLKDKDALRAIVPSAIDPDGRPSIESLRADLDFYKAQGLVKSAITVDQAVDMSWVERAVRELGPYNAK